MYVRKVTWMNGAPGSNAITTDTSIMSSDIMRAVCVQILQHAALKGCMSNVMCCCRNWARRAAQSHDV